MEKYRLFRYLRILCVTMVSLCVLAPSMGWAQGSGDVAPVASADAPAEAAAPKILRIGVIAVPKRSGDSEKALLMQTLFRTEAQSLKGGSLVLPVDGSSPQELEQVRRWVDEGAAMMRGNRFTDATGLYEEAANILNVYTGIPDRRLAARVYKGRAIVALMADDKEVATDYAQRSLLFWPNQMDGAWGYNMETSRLHRSVTVGWETTPDGGLQVETSPAKAEVFVDGLSRGFAPMTVEQLRTGTHHVLVVKDGKIAVAKWVDVESEKFTLLDLSLAPTESAKSLKGALKRFPRVSSKAKRAAATLESIAAAHGGLDALLVIIVSVSKKVFKLDGMVYTSDGSARPVREDLRQDAYLLGNVKGIVRNVFGLEFSDIDEGAWLEPPTVHSVSAGVMGADGEGGEAVFIAGGGEVFQEDKKTRTRSIYSEWWFWTGAAVLVGGIVTTVVLLAGEDPGAQGPTGDIHLKFNTPAEATF